MQDPGKMLYEFSRGSEAPLVTGDNNPTFWEAAHLSLSLSLFYIFVRVCEWKMWKQLDAHLYYSV